VRRSVFGANSLGARCPWGEMSVGRKVHKPCHLLLCADLLSSSRLPDWRTNWLKADLRRLCVTITTAACNTGQLSTKTVITSTIRLLLDCFIKKSNKVTVPSYFSPVSAVVGRYSLITGSAGLWPAAKGQKTKIRPVLARPGARPRGVRAPPLKWWSSTPMLPVYVTRFYFTWKLTCSCPYYPSSSSVVVFRTGVGSGWYAGDLAP